MEWIFLVLIAVVIVFGIGVLVWNRRRAAQPTQAPLAPAPTRLDRPPQPAPSATAVVEPEAPTFRGRLARARSAFAGTFAGVLSRGGITDATWDDLEEGLLRADVGLGVAGDLLDGLRGAVKSKEITDPADLLDALRGEMKARLVGADRSLRFDEATAPQRVAVRRRQRRRQDDEHRQGRQSAGRRRSPGAARRWRHVPRRCRRAVDDVG